MKNFLLSLLVAAGLIGSASAQLTGSYGGGIQGSAYSQLTGDLTNGLVAYYGFNGNYNDSVGGNNLNNINSILGADRFGGFNSALTVTSTSGAISASNIGITGNHNRTISLWMLDTTPSSTAGVMVSWGENILWQMQTLQYSPFWNNNSTYSIGTDGCFANSSILTTPSTLSINWHNIAWTFNSINSDYAFYVDGILQTNNPFTYGLSSMNTANSQLHVNVNNVGGGLGINGSLDDIGIWNTALTSQQVSQLYSLQSVPEPSTYALLGLGSMGTLLAVRGKKLC